MVVHSNVNTVASGANGGYDVLLECGHTLWMAHKPEGPVLCMNCSLAPFPDEVREKHGIISRHG